LRLRVASLRAVVGVAEPREHAATLPSQGPGYGSDHGMQVVGALSKLRISP
jgi:hypothetical protein